MMGAVRGVDPETGHHFDDTRRYIDAADLTDAATPARSTRPTLGGSSRASRG